MAYIVIIVTQLNFKNNCPSGKPEMLVNSTEYISLLGQPCDH